MKVFTKPNDINDLDAFIGLAKEYKKDPYKTNKLGENKTICLVFCNPSLRTRISMQKAAFNLGMKTIVFDLSKDGWQLETEEGVIMGGSSQEHIKEAISVISSYVDIIGIRSFPKLKNREEDYQDNLLPRSIISFYYSNDGSNWNQLGSDHTSGVVIDLIENDSFFEVGGWGDGQSPGDQYLSGFVKRTIIQTDNYKREYNFIEVV